MDGQDERRLAISAKLHGDNVVVDVEDNGPGFADELRDHLFASFGSMKAAGLGVGLTICRTIIEAHGGRISVGRSNAEGSAVTFELSAAQKAMTFA